MDYPVHINEKWVYTYDYAPDSVWDKWREKTDRRPDWIEAEAEEVTGRVRANPLAASIDRLMTFLLLTDSHFTYNGTWDDTVSSMRVLSMRIRFDGIIHLGDLSDGLLPMEGTKVIVDRCVSDMESLGIPLYIVPGNHDYNYFRKNPDVYYPEKPQYYADRPEHMLRMIFIDSFDPKEPVRYGFTDYCIHWLEAALRTLPEGYCALVFSHLPPLVRLQAWTKNIRNREKLIEVLDRYSDKILAYINGHNHCDLLFNDLHNGRFPVISINCAKCEYFTEHKPEGAVVPYRKLGDRTQESFDILQVDTVGRKMFFTRFGAGDDRIVTDGCARWI